MTTISGDLLSITKGIIAHQVNCIGVTGGLAGALRRKYPTAFKAYDFACKTETEDRLIGTSTICPSTGNQMDMGGIHFILHVFGQRTPGPNTDIEAVKLALNDAARQISVYKHLTELPIYFPNKMGCGLGGGDWNEYGLALHQAFPSGIIVKHPKYS